MSTSMSKSKSVKTADVFFQRTPMQSRPGGFLPHGNLKCPSFGKYRWLWWIFHYHWWRMIGSMPGQMGSIESEAKRNDYRTRPSPIGNLHPYSMYSSIGRIATSRWYCPSHQTRVQKMLRSVGVILSPFCLRGRLLWGGVVCAPGEVFLGGWFSRPVKGGIF